MAVPEDALESEPLLPEKTRQVTAVFKRRWYIIFVFSIGSFTQAMIWNTWGPITESAEVVYGWHDSDIGMFANFGNIGFLLTILPMCYFMDVKGLRISLLVCSLLVMVGAGLRCLPLDTSAMIWLADGCAVLVGIGGSVPFAGPAKISSVWFPPDQRTTATSIVSFANYIGVGMSFIIGPQLVSSPRYAYVNSTEQQNGSLSMVLLAKSSFGNGTHKVVTNKAELRTDIEHLMYFHAAMGALFFLAILLYFPDKPPKPPSQTAAIERTEWLKGLGKLASNGAFWLVVLAGALPTGVLGVWASVLDVNLKPHGITQMQAGYMGFWQTLAGSVSGLVIARFADVFMRRMKLFLLTLYVGAVVCSVWFTVLCEKYISFNIVELYTSCILMGIFVNGGIPLFYEITCEASYPVSEGVTGGVMTFVNNLVGIAFLFIMLIKSIGTAWMNWALLGSILLAIPLLLIFPERYRRTDLDITINIPEPSVGDVQCITPLEHDSMYDSVPPDNNDS